MVPLRRYFASSEIGSNDQEGDDDSGPVCIGPAIALEDHEADEESVAALKYLESVKTEAKSLPFAIEAVFPDVSVDVRSRPPVVDYIDSSSSSCDDEMVEVVIEYFQSLRELINRDRISTESKSIKFVEGMSDAELACADFASISTAIESLADSLDSLSPECSLEYMWGLLVYLEYPLLEDTSASLQRLRRYCDDLIATDKELSHRASACSIIISHFFHQPA